MTDLKTVGKDVKKVDGLALATGLSKFTDDYKFEKSLQILFLYSPHAHARIKKIDSKKALDMDGVLDVLTWENTPGTLHTTAGQGYPEPSPYDTKMFDNKVRFVGDRVAAVVAETEDIAELALKAIDVEYEILPAVFESSDSQNSDSPRIADSNSRMPIDVPYEPEKNLAAEVSIGFGDVDKGMSEADFKMEAKYANHYASHAMIEPHCAQAYIDDQGRMVIISATQVPFHARRIVSMVLEIPVAKIRVIKPRIGGGFGGKQEVFLDQVVAFVTWKFRRPSRIFFSRKEVFVASRTRHPMKVDLKMGVNNDGSITAIDLQCLMNTGAYGSHALTVLSNAGSKVLPLLNKVEHVNFFGQSVYTNLPVGGAYRGYGATQAYFALNCELDKIAIKTGIDLLGLYKKWHIREGETSQIFQKLGEGKAGVAQIIKSCKLDDCIDRGAAEIGWYEKRGKRIERTPGCFRGVGSAIAMQGSGIPKIDMASAYMKMNDDGSFNLAIGATDIGTGSDTILAQIAAEVLHVAVEKMIVYSSDTDFTPFDVGAYASSTTYVSGQAVEKCAYKIADQISSVGADMLGLEKKDVFIKDEKVCSADEKSEVSFSDIACHSLYSDKQFQIQADASFVPVESPPPFIAQFAEVEVDIATGKVSVIEFVSAVDCGQPIHPKLAEGQVEGAALNGIGYSLIEEYRFDKSGTLLNGSFSKYKILSPADLPSLKTILVESWEETGPFGAKSIGEIAINGPMPAIANAIYDAVGIRLYETPFTPEKVFLKLKEKKIAD